MRTYTSNHGLTKSLCVPHRRVSSLRVLDPANPGFAGGIVPQRREAIPQPGVQENVEEEILILTETILP